MEEIRNWYHGLDPWTISYRRMMFLFRKKNQTDQEKMHDEELEKLGLD